MKPKSDVPFLVSLALICVGTLAGFFLVGGFFSKPAPAPTADLEAANQRMAKIQAQLDALQKAPPTPTQPGTSADAAFLAGLKQHEALLAEIRSELQAVKDETNAGKAALEEAKETERRTREAATVFLGVFAVVAGLLVGQGYLAVSGWKDRAEEQLRDAISDVEKKKNDLDSNVQRTFTEVENKERELDAKAKQLENAVDQKMQELYLGLRKFNDAQPLLTQLTETQASLETNMPIFLDRARGQVLQNENKDPSATLKQGDLVLIDEIDHLTYLANPTIRFQKDRTPKQVEEYLQSLLLVGRGHFARNNYDEAISRFEEFLKIASENPNVVVEKRDRGRALSYRAFAKYHLLRKRRTAPSWIRDANQDSTRILWGEALADARAAEADDLVRALFVQALLYSREYVGEWLLNSQPGLTRYLEGQREAIRLYEKMMEKNFQLTFWPVPINLACCLKRVADRTGDASDYRKLVEKLESFPSDEQLEISWKSGTGTDIQNRFLWQNLMADSDLFGELIRIEPVEYTRFWKELLDKKVTLRNWSADLDEIRRVNPSANRWAVKL